MFIKTIVKTDKGSGKRYEYYRLCEGYRIGGKVRHRTIVSLGPLKGVETKADKKLLADRIESLLKAEGSLFEFDLPAFIEGYAQAAYKRIVEEQLLDVKPPVKPSDCKIQEAYKEVDVNSIRHDEARELGAEWLCKQTVEQLALPSFLRQYCSFDKKEVRRAIMHIISRAVYPASEHKTAEWIRSSSAVAELCDLPSAKVSRHQLYDIAGRLYSCKNRLEEHLSVKTNELFDLEDKIIFYDLTNTFFEGTKSGSKIARFGKSKEKRSDAKIVTLAAVVNAEGFLKYSQTYPGNIGETSTLEATINDLSTHSSCCDRKPVIVMDAGIASEDNLKMLREKGYRYLCVSRVKLKDYQSIKADRQATVILDKRENPITLEVVKAPDKTDHFLYVRSQKKAFKEAAMNEHFSERYEQELEHIKEALHKKGGTKKLDKVAERIGRLKERYPSANKHYKITIIPDNKKIKAADLKWTKNRDQPGKTEGVYFIRTNMDEDSETILWTIYNTLTEIEATFRVLKTELSLRPVFHQKDEHTEAHLFLGLLAYQVVATIRYQLKVQHIHHDWRNIVRIMNTQKLITTTMKAKDGKIIRIKKSTEPGSEVKQIYDVMNFKHRPYIMKKSVVPET